MKIQELGYTKKLEEYRIALDLDAFDAGRVVSEHKERYVVKTAAGEFEAELIGNLRFTAEDRHDFPAVGDWVAISEYDKKKALIHHIFPRKSVLERQSAGKIGQAQIIATNIDVGLIVQSVNRDFNINRLERYLTLCNASKINPVIVLSKIDLITADELNSMVLQVRERIRDVPVLPISNTSRSGIEDIRSLLNKGLTYCLLGSSGVGKSTLINTLTGKDLMETGEISESIDRGRHVTTRRELIVTEYGILIDNPGMREVGITGAEEGLETTFDEIAALTGDCKFSDCTHTSETGCAVIEAVEKGELDSGSYENFMKLQRERAFFESTVEERRQKDKSFGKMIKQVLKEKKKNKF